MSRRILALTALAAGSLGLAACSQGSATTTAKPSAPAASAQPSAPAASVKPSAAPASSAAARAGALPDICKLMSKAEVKALTGESVTVMTDDGGASAGSRYCQWQLSQGQLTVTVSLETRESFDVRNKEAVAVAGVGTAAYSLSGHLFVWQDGRDVDVYVSSESDDQANLTVARRTAQQLLPRLAAK